jgi:DNA-nicking Smr family endonuclease
LKIDLHGYTVHNAWKQFNTLIEDAYYDNQKRVEVVTGQGKIMQEMPSWIQTHPLIREYIQQHYNPGSFICILNKRISK